MIVLKPGLAAQPLTGSPARATVSVRFKDGLADVPEGELSDLMLAHPGFNSDFILADLSKIDPFLYTRQPSEPAHVVTEIKYGSPVGREVTGGRVNITPELQRLVQDMAVSMAKEMLPGMVKETLKTLMAEHKDQKEEVPAAEPKKKGNPNWKKGAKKVEIQTEANPREQQEVS
jgi:hypothetical protein